ncbi:MAG TPA: translation factor GTPase family protein [Gaiellaceae bacterium]|nr:translation factor GTPase family protein [Gaiellaceae bacterium]
MLHPTLNLGILAHVDAGKTTLTERLLYDAGVIAAPGSVDRGTTQTDTLALERERGITIKAAVVSFPLDDVTVNLIDTPGHPDFIAEVERALAVLDGAVLVVSAVEGVQAQTLVLMRALRRLAIPTVLFVNKVDRRGADVERVLDEIRGRLGVAAVPLWTSDPERIAESDDRLLAAYLEGADLDAAVAESSRRGLVHPAFAGSALTGEGVEALERAITRLLPAGGGDPEAPLDAAVFKIDRGAHGEKIAYARLFAGTIRTRDRIGDEKVTALEVFEHGGPARRPEAVAGEIARLWGLPGVRIGDRLGGGSPRTPAEQFPRPMLEAAVEPVDPDDGARLRVALEQLAEQDPLIGVRQRGAELSVSIYGEVQKEVLEATLAREHGLAVAFRETRPIFIERPAGVGEAVELLNADSNPFHAQVGLRIEPAPPDSGVAFRLDVAHDRIPLYAFKRREDFEDAMTAYVREALRRGPNGWEVTDCVVTMTDSWYSLADGPPSRRGPLSRPSDFHGLTSIVMGRAVVAAGTVVCEPILHVRLEIPTWSIGATIAAAAQLGAELEQPSPGTETTVVAGTIAAVRVNDLQRRLPTLTRGEGLLESSFAGYRPAVSAVPG